MLEDTFHPESAPRAATTPYDVVVVGGGHAGCEAALAAARLGVRVALATLERKTIGALSCNPAMGGVGKGQLVREIDALGGEMGRTTDAVAIHYRMLNTSKGEAVQSLRAQVDKDDYARAMQQTIDRCERLDVVEGPVDSVIIEGDRAHGVRFEDGSELRARAVILTNGTFLRGLMHTGEKKVAGGRIGEGAVGGLTGCLEALGFETARLKTGTPPRLDARSIDWSRTTEQLPDPDPEGFSFWLDPPRREWISCHVTRTNEVAHDAIRDGLHRSPMFSGEIEGIGPRYCPSIEDKVVRFPDRDGHTVHLEVEGRNTHSIYVNGVSTSLPQDIQESVIHSIAGLERAEFLRYGYAVEYDFFPPHQIETTFESRGVSGLYLAGQICGTSGYEEAGAQGLMAGINSARAILGESPVTLGRDEAYIGVLADDLVRCDPREPYRMFTSRAEHRLILRFDNADDRLMEVGESIGLVPTEVADRMRAKRGTVAEVLGYLRERRIGPDPIVQRLRVPGAVFEDLYELDPSLEERVLSAPEKQQVLIQARYERYIERQQAQIDKMRRLEEWTLPRDFDYSRVAGLSREATEKLNRYHPRTLGQAGRIAGITPADLSILMVRLRVDEAAARAPKGDENDR